jgi:ornithine cyclodeaminase/alanine dehydrogenase-like protein (mu-crystallin family)
VTLVLSESQTESLLVMEEVVAAVEEAFRREAEGQAVNSARSRSPTARGVLNVMHAALPYLGRAGVKCYLSSPRGTRFVFVLFDLDDSSPLLVMGADMLGRFRTGAASGVATKFLYRGSSATLAVFGSGKQAMTQVRAIAAVKSLAEVKVWSPDRAHREAFARRLSVAGLSASASDTPASAADGAQIGTTITAAKVPFLDAKVVAGLSHLNVCGGNNPDQSEITSDAVGSFQTVVVDDLAQAKVEYGDLIQAANAGTFEWHAAVELKDFVAGKSKPAQKTLFKSGGAALEDVAVASMVYDKAMKAGLESATEIELGLD